MLVLAGVLYAPALDILPLHGDNLYVLAWVDQARFADLLPLDPAIYPEWRPLSYLTIWVEHRLFDLRAVFLHHAVNLLLLASCGWLVYRLAAELGGSRASAALAGVVFVADPRTLESLVWIVERQTLIACVCGLTALLVALRAGSGGFRWREVVLVAALLLAAALAKEYGLAFALAIAAYGALIRHPALATSGVAAAAVYAAMRQAFSAGATAEYCEDMGFFLATREVCFDGVSMAAAPQMIYNVAATAFGTLIPGLLGETGAYNLRPVLLVFGGTIFCLAAIGVARGPRFLGLLALVPFTNAVLSFMLFRPRNQLIGTCAVAIAFGVGLAHSRRLLEGFGSVRLLRMSLAAAGAFVLTLQMARSHTQTRVEVARLRAEEPCASSVRERPFGNAFVARVKAQFGLADANCRSYDITSVD